MKLSKAKFKSKNNIKGRRRKYQKSGHISRKYAITCLALVGIMISCSILSLICTSFIPVQKNTIPVVINNEYVVETEESATTTDIATDALSSIATTITNISTNIETTTTTTTATITQAIEVVTVVEESSVICNTEYIIEEPTVEEYLVYKPESHYVHKSTCHWANVGEVQRIENTDGIESRKCTECNPDIEIVNEYVEPIIEEPVYDQVTIDNYSLTYLKSFSRGTFYPGTAYSSNPMNISGGSGRTLIDGAVGDGTGVKGSLASNYIYRNYGYNRNGGRTLVYIECDAYEEMNGLYYLDDSQGYNNEVIDFFYYYSSNCPFQQAGVVTVDAWIVD